MFRTVLVYLLTIIGVFFLMAVSTFLVFTGRSPGPLTIPLLLCAAYLITNKIFDGGDER